jgi:hypothetical protein
MSPPTLGRWNKTKLIIFVALMIAIGMAVLVDRIGHIGNPHATELSASGCEQQLGQCESELEDLKNELTKCNARADASGE